MNLFMAIANLAFSVQSLAEAARKRKLLPALSGAALLAACAAFGWAAVKSGELEIIYQDESEDSAG